MTTPRYAPDGFGAPTVELVTTSHEPDAELCTLLVESVRRHVAPSIQHSIFVPRRELERFAHLAGPRTRLIAQEDVVSRRVTRSITVHWRGGERKLRLLGLTPVRGWLFQQIVKLAAASVLDADVLVFVDSDTAFCRSFDESLVLRNDHVRLFADANHPPTQAQIKWHRTAARLLGIASRDWFGANYVSQLVVWRRDVTLELCQRINSVCRQPWENAVARKWHFSEDTVYGIFAQHILGGDRHFATAEDLAHESWSYDVASEDEIERFRTELKDHHVIVGIQSRGPVSLERRKTLYKWFEAAALDPAVRSRSGTRSVVQPRATYRGE